MGQAKEISLRQKVVTDRQMGESYQCLSVRYGLSYLTVRRWCQRHTLYGEAGLVPSYQKCGRRVKAEACLHFRFVRLMAHLHPTWGMPFIVCRIRQKYPELALQTPRHYQRRIRRKFGTLPAPTLPKTAREDRARQPHEVWQVDAKERITLADGSGAEACFLNFTDEKTSGLLKAVSFPPGADLSGRNK
jgi:transposase